MKAAVRAAFIRVGFRFKADAPEGVGDAEGAMTTSQRRGFLAQGFDAGFLRGVGVVPGAGVGTGGSVSLNDPAALNDSLLLVRLILSYDSYGP